MQKTDTIIGYALHVTPRCTIPMTSPGPHGEPPLTLADMTLGELHYGLDGGGDIIGLCMGGMSCGNSGEPSMGFVIWGVHANDETNIAASASVSDTNGDKVEKASEIWVNSMKGFPSQEAKDDYLSDITINCDHRFDAAGIHAMWDVPVQYFFFGRTIPDIAHSCVSSAK